MMFVNHLNKFRTNVAPLQYTIGGATSIIITENVQFHLSFFFSMSYTESLTHKPKNESILKFTFSLVSML